MLPSLIRAFFACRGPRHEPLEVGGGGEWAFTQYTAAGGTVGRKPAWYQAGLQIGFGHWTVGVSGAYMHDYLHADYSAATNATSDDNGWVVTGGASYVIDAWSFGLQGLYAEYQQSALNGVALAPGFHADNQIFWGASLNGAYALGPGISLEAQAAYTASNYGNVTFGPFGASVPVPAAVGVNSSKVHSFELDLGTAINF